MKRLTLLILALFPALATAQPIPVPTPPLSFAPPRTIPSFPTSQPTSTDCLSNYYYEVAIPLRGKDGTAIQRRLFLAGIDPLKVSVKDDSRGKYVAIGAFCDRQSAENTNNKTRTINLDSRVIFKKG